MKDKGMNKLTNEPVSEEVNERLHKNKDRTE